MGTSSSEETPSARRRRRQFSLRELLLWTTLAAICLGILQWLIADREFTVSLSCWIAVVVIVRMVLGPKAAGMLFVAAGMVLHAIVGYRVLSSHRPVPVAGVFAGVLVCLLVGSIVGGILWLLVETAARAVRWADTRLAGKAPTPVAKTGRPK